jgi:hypothetical protein
MLIVGIKRDGLQIVIVGFRKTEDIENQCTLTSNDSLFFRWIGYSKKPIERRKDSGLPEKLP